MKKRRLLVVDCDLATAAGRHTRADQNRVIDGEADGARGWEPSHGTADPGPTPAERSSASALAALQRALGDLLEPREGDDATTTRERISCGVRSDINRQTAPYEATAKEAAHGST